MILFYRQLIIGFLLLGLSHQIFADKIVVVALAFSGKDYAQKSWQPTIDYLQQKIPNHSFELISIEPSNIKVLENLVGNHQVDFVIIQPISYVDLEVLYGTTGIVTLVDKSKHAKFGSVIFTRSDANIQTLSDVKNRIIAGATPKGLGGWLIAYNVFLEAGIDLHQDSKKVMFLGVQDNIVQAVLAKQVDVGIVRTGVLERMIRSGTLNRQQLRVINAKKSTDFPYYLSSDLYPEWVFAKTKKVNSTLAKQVSFALLSMPKNHIAAQARGYWEWITPINYQPIHTLMKKLKIGVYSNYGKVSLTQYIQQNSSTVILMGLLLLGLIVASFQIFKLNRSLKKSQYSLTEHHNLVLNLVYEGVYGVDLSGKCTFFNKAATRMTDFQAKDMVGKQQHEVLHHSYSDGSHYPVSQCPVYHTFIDGKSRFIEKDIFWKKDGSCFAVEYSCTAIKDKTGQITGGVVVFRDISERQKTQQKLQKYQSDLFHMTRINTLGEMVAGIAHELNQPLTTISTSAYVGIKLLKSEQLDREKLLKIINLIHTQSERSSQIIKQLRRMITKQTSEKLWVNVNHLIEDVLKIIHIEADKLAVKITCHLHPSLPKILVQPIQIDQVILNLCKNAIEAFEAAPRHKSNLIITTKMRNDEMIINIKDNVVGGVNRQIIDTLFDPFVSGKPQGIGLGLSISQEIIRAHDGNLRLKTSTQTGSEFEFSLPKHTYE